MYFVYLQAICVAESWLKHKRNEDVDANDLLRSSGRVPSPSPVNAKRIEEVVVEYQKLFAQEDEKT
jgi:hypothetical protein